MSKIWIPRILFATVCLVAGSPSLGGVTVAPVWCGESDQTYAEFGYSLSTVGDVNRDGHSDVIVGARRYSGTWSEQGRASVFLGGPGGTASSPVWTAEGDTTDAWFGWSVATAGDVNADGYAEVLVGVLAYASNPTETGEGRVCLFLGSPGGPAVAPSWTWEVNQAGGHVGSSVATAGDVNGDGLADVIIGAPKLSTPEGYEGVPSCISARRRGCNPPPPGRSRATWSVRSSATPSPPRETSTVTATAT